jgi:hypothetical protein
MKIKQAALTALEKQVISCPYLGKHRHIVLFGCPQDSICAWQEKTRSTTLKTLAPPTARRSIAAGVIREYGQGVEESRIIILENFNCVVNKTKVQ